MKTIDGIYIPSPVCFNMTLPASAKLLYGEIALRCQEQGCCELSNQYFAKLYEVTPKTAAR